MNKSTIKNVKSAAWMPCPKADIAFPGQAYLCPLNQLIVAKETDTYHDIIGIKDIGYTIFNNEGQKVFLAVQKGKYKYEIKIFNYYGNEVLQVKGQLAFCLNKALIWAPPGNFLGSVQETKSCLKTYLVNNHLGQKLLKIKATGLFGYKYNVLLDNEVVGLVTNRWRFANFKVSFPIEMDIGLKCILLGASFLICLKKSTCC